MENIKKYSYINYKDFSKDGFRLRTNNVIQGVRNSSIKNKDTPELRVGSADLPLNVIGVIFNPSNRHLECFKNKNLINDNNYNKNGFEGFMKIMKEKFNSNEHNLYYWLFDKETDLINLEEYKNISSDDTNNYIQVMLAEIYPEYLDLLYKKILNEIMMLIF